MIRRYLWILLGLVLLTAQPGAASNVVLQVDAAQDTDNPTDTTVTIKGRIFDDETGETMPYTNVFISGTNIGTMAFTDGFYIMRGLPAGTYTVKASYISYDMGSQTVTLGPGEVANLDFHLEVHAIMAEPFDVAAERALIEVDKTGSSHYITSKQMEAMPLDQMVDMVAMAPGVTMQDNEIHIRGGRADDTMFVVDGMNVSDPLSGGGYGYQIDPSIINEIEVLTGGFNAEYGQAVSGVVKVSTKEGSDRVEGRVSFKRDYLWNKVPKNDERGWQDLTNFGESQNIDIVKGSMSGPDPISAGLRALGLRLPGKQFILLSGSMDIRDGYLPIYSRQNKLQSPIYANEIWSPRQQNNWNGLAKWTWNVTPNHKLNFNLSRQFGISQGFRLPGEGYARPFMDNFDKYLVFTTENILSQVYYRQVLNDKSWLELTLGRNFNRMHANVNGNDDFRTYEPISGWDPLNPGLPAEYISQPDGQVQGGADRWHDHYSESYTVKAAYSFMGAGNNEFKTGVDLSFTEMQLVDLQTNLGAPPSGKLGIKEDVFLAHPITGAAFFQDTVNYRGLIINAGLRADWWAPGKEVEKVMANPDDYLFITQEMADEFYDKTFDVMGRNWKMRFSPRLGLSFPVTERDKFFFNYGHFNQWPRFAYVYPQLEAQAATEVQLLGNPNLDPKVTIEYETGLQHEFGGLWSMGVTFFNRDIYDYAKSVRLGSVDIGAEETPDPDDTGTVTIEPVRYFNGDSARSLGIEMTITKRTTRWLSGSGSLELQRTTGTNSNADEAYLQATYDEAYTPTASIGGLTRTPLLWDKPWTMSFNLDFSVFDDDQPEIFGWRMPQNWSLNLLARAEAGQRYTPYTYVGFQDYLRGGINSATGPYKSSINVRFNKFWKFGPREKLTVYLEVRNLLNHKNFRRINPFTGDGYKVGDYNPRWVEDWDDPENQENPYFATTNSEDYAKGVVDPSYIENPLTLLWGVSYSW
jgi:CarboxypepD_reg-like domain/TonB-dependent Receptor Plug Domain